LRRWLSLHLAVAEGAVRPEKPADLDVPCNPGDPPCSAGLLCVELFPGLSPNDKTCRLHCESDTDCPQGYHCLLNTPRATSNVCVIDGLVLPH
jgi:hypothetical protein